MTFRSSEPSAEPPVPLTPIESQALERLIAVASNDTRQSAVVADFLLCWADSGLYGRWDPTELWEIDGELAAAIVVVVGYVVRARQRPTALGYGPELDALARQWRSGTGETTNSLE